MALINTANIGILTTLTMKIVLSKLKFKKMLKNTCQVETNINSYRMNSII